MIAYLPGSWLALVGPAMSVVIDAEWGDPVADTCWALVSRGCGHVELLDIVAALPGFALVGAQKLRLAGAITAQVGDASFSGADARTWSSHDLPAGTPVRLMIGEPEEDSTSRSLPLVGGVVGVRELWIEAAEADRAQPTIPEHAARVHGSSAQDDQPTPEVPAQEQAPAPPSPPDGSTQAKSEAKLDRMFRSGAADASPEPDPAPAVDETPVTRLVPVDPTDGETRRLPPTPNVHSEPRYSPPTYARDTAMPSALSPMMDDILGLHAPAPSPHPGAKPATIPIPWVLVFPTGSPYPLDRAALVGRQPGARGNPQGMTLLEVPQHHTDVSRVHLEVRPGEHGVEVVNRSEHGTLVRAPGRPASHLGLGENALVDAGTVLQLSEGFRLTIEASR